MLTIDLNCDIGEAFGNYSMPNDLLLMDFISSANVACGFHAGDPGVMQKTVAVAMEKKVAIGAHPGLPDLQGFGRRNMQLTPNEAYQITLYQIGALDAFVRAAGGKMHHVKPHGALYNMAAKDASLAGGIAQAVFDFDRKLILYGLSGSMMIKAAVDLGLRTASEVFADRSYQDDGSLTPRSLPNAMISSEEQSVSQVMEMIKSQQVTAVSGKQVSIKPDTLCLHGDGEHAVPFARLIFARLKNEGIVIMPPKK